MNSTETKPVATAQPLHRHAWIVAVILVLLLAMQIRPWWRPTRDGTGYLSIARSVVTHFYQHTPLTRYGDRNIYYAPGYPIIISPAFVFSDHPFLGISIIHFVMACVFLAGVFVWAKGLVNPNAAMAITVLVGVNVSFWNYYRTTVSELSMMMWMIWAAVALRKILLATTSRDALRWTLIATFLVFAAGISRQVGCFVVGGFFLAGVILWREKKIHPYHVILGSIVTALPIALTLVWLAQYDKAMAAHSSADTSRTYVDFVRQGSYTLTDQIIEGFRLRISEIGRMLVPGMYKAYGERGHGFNFSYLVYIPLSAAVVWGWWKMARKTNDLLLWTMLAYVGLYIVWSFDADTRYFTPILPVLWICMWYYIEKIPQQKRVPIVVLLCAAHLVLSLIYWEKEVRKEHGQWRQYWPNVQKLVAAVPEEERHDLVASIHLDEGARLEWMLTTDRLAPSVERGKTLNEKFHYALMYDNEPMPEGFELVKKSGILKLGKRTQTISTQTTQP